jgi:hypothetical protein
VKPDAKVWTSEAVTADGCYWVLWQGGKHMAFLRVIEGCDIDVSWRGTIMQWSIGVRYGLVRSILPIPSAEEVAALYALRDATVLFRRANNEAARVLAVEAIDAALTRLEQARG